MCNYNNIFENFTDLLISIFRYYSLAACAALIKYMEFKQNMSYAFHSLKIVYRTNADTTMISKYLKSPLPHQIDHIYL